MHKARLTGAWELRLVGRSDDSVDDSRAGSGVGEWRPVAVPGCWEEAGLPKDEPGPVDYRTTFTVPELAPGDRVWLRFGAVSYACEVYVDEQEVGRHVGMWDPFWVEITSAVRSGGESVLRVRVEKPASLTAGPDSPTVPGRYPTRETLAGFLPYVWGHVHGGIWQDVELVVTGPVVFGDVTAWGTPDGDLEAPVSAPGRVRVSVTDPSGVLVAEDEQDARSRATFRLSLPSPRAWSPRDPALYTVRLSVDDGAGGEPARRSDEVVRRVGLRQLAVDGSRILLNGEPLYPRMVLSWGWYPDRLHPRPEPARVRADLAEMRRLGFNGVKLCLWFPPEYYLDIADELGMLLWVELPMWLPHPTARFRAQLDVEAERLVRVARDHPSVVLYTLGCELSSVVGPDVLEPLYAKVKGLARDALVRDNSGSGEAYGGLLTEYADFYDHHLYCEPHHFRETVEHFAPAWRELKPWLFGEFCDLDTFRDLRRFDERWDDQGDHHSLGDHQVDGAGRPWWTSRDPAVNPQGARWQYDVHEHEARLRATGFWERGQELEALSRRQALLHRKVTLEAVRIRRDTSGYVVTGERDTPISTAGLWDDLGRLKFAPEEFRAFNADLVLCLGWDRRRTWLAGGDRPAFVDTWCYEENAVVRPHLVLAHHGREDASVQVDWTVVLDDGVEVASGGSGPGPMIRAGSVTEVGVAEFRAPRVDRPRVAVLRARASVGRESTTNAWRFWIFPKDPWRQVGACALIDPGARLHDLLDLAPGVVRRVGPQLVEGVLDPARLDPWGADPTLDDTTVVLATRWTSGVARHVRRAGRAVLLADHASDCPVPLLSRPFWREAVNVVEPHPAWGDFPHDGGTDLQFAGCATDLVLDTGGVRGPRCPLLRRVDTRTAEVHDYATEIPWGAGRLLLTTLRFEGSTGDQPRGLRHNTGASYLLSRLVRYLAESATPHGPRNGEQA